MREEITLDDLYRAIERLARPTGIVIQFKRALKDGMHDPRAAAGDVVIAVTHAGSGEGHTLVVDPKKYRDRRALDVLRSHLARVADALRRIGGEVEALRAAAALGSLPRDEAAALERGLLASAEVAALARLPRGFELAITQARAASPDGAARVGDLRLIVRAPGPPAQEHALGLRLGPRWRDEVAAIVDMVELRAVAMREKHTPCN